MNYNSIDTTPPNDYNPFKSQERALPRTSTRYSAQPQFNPSVLPASSANSILNETAPILVNKTVQDTKMEQQSSKKENKRKKESEINIEKVEEGAKDKSNNFPPCKPCFYQDFERDFDDINRPTVKLGYHLWLGESLLLLINILGTLSYMIIKDANSESSGVFGISILLFALFCPLSYLLWFRPLYKCLRSQSSLNFFTFFLFIGIHIVLDFIQCLGINWLGSCGWFNAFVVIKTNIGVGCFMIIIALGFTLVLILKLFLVFKTHRLFRTSGANLSKAKVEIITEAIR